LPVINTILSFLFHDAKVGTIEVGKTANLLLMRTSPLKVIGAYDSVETVWVGGKQAARAELRE
jgi:imidazolonepropionase-like amidohydrolase